VQYEPAPECLSSGWWVIEPLTPTLEQLADMLRRPAAGEPAREAAVELLIGHRHWLHVRQFRGLLDCYLGYGNASSTHPDTPHALIDWTLVGEALDNRSFPASSSELAILRIAAALACHDISVNLRNSLSGLDRTNARLVVDAIAHAAGARRP
jgi:hypothetical protein